MDKDSQGITTQKARGRGPLLVVLLLVLVVTGVLVASYAGRRGRDTGVTVSGAIEATEIDLSSGVGGRIRSVMVEEGDTVKKGQVVAELDDAELTALVQEANGNLAIARARLAELLAGGRRVKAPAVNDGVGRTAVSPAVMAVAEQNPALAKAILAQSSAGSAIPEASTGRPRYAIDIARGQVTQAEGLLAQAKARLGQAAITAPEAGIVVGKFREVGEFVAPGTPIFRVSNLDKVWLRVYAPLPTLGRIKIGQAARVTTDAYASRTYDGRVVSISEEPEFTPKNAQTAEERVKLVYAIRIALVNKSHELKPGMPANAYLELGLH